MAVEAEPLVETTLIDQSGALDITGFFRSLDPTNCPIVDYLVDQVLDSSGVAVEEHGLDVTNFGSLKYQSTNVSYTGHQVYAKASNDGTSGPFDGVLVAYISQVSDQQIEIGQLVQNSTSNATSEVGSNDTETSPTLYITTASGEILPVPEWYHARFMAEVAEILPPVTQDYTKYLVPRIDSIDQIGRVRVRFNSDIKPLTEYNQLNLTQLNL